MGGAGQLVTPSSPAMAFKIYTKSGDAGQTALYGGRRVSKADLRLDAYGTVDELNAHIGVLAAVMAEQRAQLATAFLQQIQSQLFTIGSQLATPPDKELSIKPIAAAHIAALEEQIDRHDEDLPPLSSFILPAGSMACAQAHVCRTVTRRAERLVVALSQNSPVDAAVLQYLNRLSDYFFTLARAITHAAGHADTPWVAEK